MKYLRYSILFFIVVFTSISAYASSDYGGIATDDLQGYWKPSFSKHLNPKFEFFNGTTVVSPDMTLRTGRIDYKNKPEELFYWENSADGNLQLSVVAGDCPIRPLTSCSTIANVTIQAYALGKNRYYWDIDYDDLDNNSEDIVYHSIYKKKGLRFKKLSNGEIYLNSASNLAFASPYSGYKADDNISIVLDVLDSVVEVSADFPSDKNAKILHFTVNDELTSSSSATFPTEDGGSVDVNVVSTLSSVSMVSSKRRKAKAGGPANHNYVLSWAIEKSIEFPDGVSPESVDLSSFIPEERHSQVVELFDKFIPGPQLAEGDLYFTHFPSNFLSADGFANAVNFSDASIGTVSFTNAIDENLGQEKAFTWEQAADGEVNFHFVDSGISTTMRFLTKINGGYRVLYSVPDEVLGTRYFIRDFIVSADMVLDQFSLPGDYKVLNITSKPNGSYLFDVNFNADGTNSGDLSGFWFENIDGSIQSYECYDFTGALIPDYFDCLSAVQTNGVSFAWIRKISFIHQKKNEFKAKYNSVILDPSAVPFPLNFAWTYRFTKVDDDLVPENQAPGNQAVRSLSRASQSKARILPRSPRDSLLMKSHYETALGKRK